MVLWPNTIGWLTRNQQTNYSDILHKYGALGVNALAAATPVDSGATANSWEYEIGSSGSRHSISWFNTNESGGKNIAIMIELGHGTGTGGYVPGRPYINNAIRPILDELTNELMREVNR